MPRGCWPASSRRRAGWSICESLARYRQVFPDRCFLLAELHRGRRCPAVGLPGPRGPPGRSAAGGGRRRALSRAPAGGLGRRADGHPLGLTVAAARGQLFPNAERHLQSPEDMAALFARQPAALARSVEIARLSTFSLDELRYEYPEELAPPGQTPADYLARLAWAGGRRALSGRRAADKVRALIEHELQLIGRIALRGLFSHRLGPGAFRPRARHPLPGPRLGGQLGRLLLPGRHLRRSRADGRALRAVRQPRAERGPRHRRRFRARAPRGGAAISLRKIWPRAGRHDGRSDHLPPPLGRPRRGQGPGPVARADRPAGQEPGWTHASTIVSRPPAEAVGIDPASPLGSRLVWLVRRAGRLSPPSLAAHRRHGHDPRAAVRTGADRKRRHARPHRHPVEQGRPRRAGHPQGRLPGPGHAHGIRKCFRPGRGTSRPPADAGQHPRRTTRRSTR